MFAQPIFVKSAQISAHLHFATEVARDISLTSKNARAITVRAGQRAAGFMAITDFIEELSKTTIMRSEAINRIAVKVSRIATEQERARIAQRGFERVALKAEEAPHIDSIDSAHQETLSIIASYQKEFSDLLEELEIELEENHKQIRTANMLVSTSKVEASQAGEFQRPLEVIAENLASAADAIKKELRTAEAILEEAKAQLNESH